VNYQNSKGPKAGLINNRGEKPGMVKEEKVLVELLQMARGSSNQKTRKNPDERQATRRQNQAKTGDAADVF